MRKHHADLLKSTAEALRVTPEALGFVAAYEVREILSAQCFTDMLHIAVATVADADVLVSWNFKHIVRLDKIRLFTAVNLEQGYRELRIYSPREVASHGQEDD